MAIGLNREEIEEIFSLGNNEKEITANLQELIEANNMDLRTALWAKLKDMTIEAILKNNERLAKELIDV